MGALEIQLAFGIYFLVNSLGYRVNENGNRSGISADVIRLVAGIILLLLAMFRISLLNVVR